MAGLFGATRSTKQVKISLTDEGGKWWAYVQIINGHNSFLPSFEELFWIIQMICECEDEKYPTGQGRLMVEDFFYDACQKTDDPDELFRELRSKYKLPAKYGCIGGNR